MALNPNLPILVTLARCSRFQPARSLLDKLEGPAARHLGELILAGVVEAETRKLTEQLAAIRELAGVRPQPTTLWDYLTDPRTFC